MHYLIIVHGQVAEHRQMCVDMYSDSAWTGSDVRLVFHRLVETQPMPGTNLLLILTELPCSTDIKLSDYEIHRPTKVDEEEEKELVCSLSRHPRRRVQSYGCYDNDPKVSEGT